jgi:tRNA nucleotidyltransferase (CCA-adding enzyme)
MKIYEVGGAVRDALLGLPLKDRDWVVVGGTEHELVEQGFRKVGADFPVFLHPQTNEEYALARTERKTGAGYKGFITDSSQQVTLLEDLARRDFTINAMARDQDGNIIDPHNGRADLTARTLRHITPAFREDPLRVLRAARFAARLGFEIAPETLILMREIAASGELQTLAAERIWQELRAALMAPHSRRFITVLRDCGALKEILPELDRLFGVPQPARYHPEIDTGEHVLLVLEQAERNRACEMVRFAALVHDLGKGTTPAEILPAHHGHEERGVALIETLSERLRIPRNHRDLACLVSRLHTRVHRVLEMGAPALVRLLEAADAWRRPERFENFLQTCTLDAQGRKGLQQTPYAQAARLRRAFELSRQVDTRALTERKLAGPAYAAALHELRVKKLSTSSF